MNNQYYNNFQPIPQNNMNNSYHLSETFKVMNVNNFEDIKNIATDYLSTYIFIDQSNFNIYLKKINNNGFQEILTFQRTANPPDRMQLLEQRLISIENSLKGLIKNESNESNDVSTNVEPVTTTESSLVSKGSNNVTREKRRTN